MTAWLQSQSSVSCDCVAVYMSSAESPESRSLAEMTSPGAKNILGKHRSSTDYAVNIFRYISLPIATHIVRIDHLWGITVGFKKNRDYVRHGAHTERGLKIRRSPCTHGEVACLRPHAIHKWCEQHWASSKLLILTGQSIKAIKELSAQNAGSDVNVASDITSCRICSFVKSNVHCRGFLPNGFISPLLMDIKLPPVTAKEPCFLIWSGDSLECCRHIFWWCDHLCKGLDVFRVGKLDPFY